MKFKGNPFFWGFKEERSIETLAKRMKATYNTPREVKEQKDTLYNPFGQTFGHSPNPAFITNTGDEKIFIGKLYILQKSLLYSFGIIYQPSIKLCIV